MLSKVSNDTIFGENLSLASINTSYYANWSGPGNSGYQEVYEILPGTTSISGTAYSKTGSSACNAYFYIMRGNTVVYNASITDAMYGVYERTIEFNNISVQSGDKVCYYIQNTFNGGYNGTLPIEINVNGNGYIYKKGVYGKPKASYTIGDMGYLIIYGIYKNNYIGGIMLEKTTTATTGNITLGNAVGYISVNFNGEIVKIPYYGN